MLRMTGKDGELPQFEVYTDGSCLGNPGPGGWAYIVRDTTTGDEVEASDGEPDTTNNRMEMLAAINGLKHIESPSRVDLYSDSKYVIEGLTEYLDGWKARGWKLARNKPVKNIELWKRLDDLRRFHDLNPIWLKAHNDHPENDRCDRLAVAAAELYKS